MFFGDELTRYAGRQVWYALRWIFVLPVAVLAWLVPMGIYLGLAYLYLNALSKPGGLIMVPLAFVGLAAFIIISAVASALATASFIQAGASMALLWRTNVALLLSLAAVAVFVIFLIVENAWLRGSVFWWFTTVGGIIGCVIGANAGLRDFLVVPQRPPAELVTTQRWH
ncbi:MAG: hypothetical protein JOZ50_02585 [Candidatus Eremiobacteraeota bacterium]|nr:hypothetical protein [Candidatus Eremiobacteraeota bacterium]